MRARIESAWVELDQRDDAVRAHARLAFGRGKGRAIVSSAGAPVKRGAVDAAAEREARALAGMLAALGFKASKMEVRRARS